MKLIKDTTGRFALRPHFQPKELDVECERLIASFLRKRRGEVSFPILTDDLAVLIEEHADSLDSYADLSDLGDDVEGMTEFFAESAPAVSISERLASDPRRENRLRTTLTHEFGHVHFHRHLWDEKLNTRRLFARGDPTNKAICKRDTILDAASYDWMEWQAGYVSGAILMPASQVRRIVDEYCEPLGLHGKVLAGSTHGRALIDSTMQVFAVSEDAARMRLIKLDLLTQSDRQLQLFG